MLIQVKANLINKLSTWDVGKFGMPAGAAGIEYKNVLLELTQEYMYFSTELLPLKEGKIGYKCSSDLLIRRTYVDRTGAPTQ